MVYVEPIMSNNRDPSTNILLISVASVGVEKMTLFAAPVMDNENVTFLPTE